MGVLRNHNAISEQEPVEWHRPRAVFTLQPVTDQVQPDVIRSTETRPSNKANAVVLANRSVGPENLVLEVLIRVMSTGTATSPLKDGGQVWVGRCDADDLTNTLDETKLERGTLGTSAV